MSGWVLGLWVPDHALAPFEAAMSGLCPAHTLQLRDGGYRIEGYLAGEPDPCEIASAFAVAAAAAGIDAPAPSLSRYGDTDWVRLSRAGLDAVVEGRLRVRGSHLPPAKVPGTVELVIDTAPAFGTGHHPTTAGCMQALDRLARRSRRLERALDLGCGTGLLAMAIARLWHCPVTALDIDPDSIAVAERNQRRNRIGGVRCGVSDGYRALARRSPGRFDLVTANILAAPLAALAAETRRHLRPGGFVVLSGLLADQDRWITNSYRRSGMFVVDRIRRDGWHTLILRRPAVATARVKRPNGAAGGRRSGSRH